jgi:hypothetical protein
MKPYFRILAASALMTACTSSNNEMADMPLVQKRDTLKIDSSALKEEKLNTYQSSLPI